MLLISIPTPCHEKWSEMSSNEQGAFCGVCSKTVIDFTSLSDEQVKNYFLQNRSKKTCGRFRNAQLVNGDDAFQQLLAGAMPFWKKFLAMVLIVFGSLLTGCTDRTMGKMVPVSTETRTELYTTTGILDIDRKNEEKMEEDKIVNSTITKGYIEGITVGDVMAEEVLISEEIICQGIEDIDYIVSKKKDENGNEVRDQDR